MLLTNQRTEAGLVNGVRGRVVGVELHNTEEDRDMDSAISAHSVKYVVVDFGNKYKGPVIWPGHPGWVPIAPVEIPHKKLKGWRRIQIPLTLCWGMTIHKSQGLTFPEGCVVDFAHRPNNQPVASVGLPFVAMSRTEHFARQAFRNMPDFWDFRKVLKQQLFAWRGQLCTSM